MTKRVPTTRTGFRPMRGIFSGPIPHRLPAVNAL